MNKQVIIQELTERIPALAKIFVDQIITTQMETYRGYSSEQLLGMVTILTQAYIHDMAHDQEYTYAEHWKRVAETRAQQEAQIGDLLKLLGATQQLIHQYVAEHFSNDYELQVWWLRRSQEVIYAAIQQLAETFVAVRERVIQQQAAQIRELSTPIIPLHKNILALPLVGTITSSRIGQVLETLLNGINEHQAEVVIIDITGVPIVDTSVAHYLLQASRAAQLLGAQVVIVGISAEVAQTITHLGVDLSNIKTRSNMQSGIEYALGQLGLRIS